MRNTATFSLDTKCIIAVDEDRPEAEAILELVRADTEGFASVALVAISASERQPGGGSFESINQFKERIAAPGLGNLQLQYKPNGGTRSAMFWPSGATPITSATSLSRLTKIFLLTPSVRTWRHYRAVN